MEPVAPRTVTARTADAGALLFRNGTALMLSPHHKTATDAIHATPQKAQEGRENDGGNETVQTIQQAAMTRNQMTGILNAETPLNGGFEEIARLGGNREDSGQGQHRERIPEINNDKNQTDDKARRK